MSLMGICSRTFALTTSCLVEDAAPLVPEHDDRRIALFSDHLQALHQPSPESSRLSPRFCKLFTLQGSLELPLRLYEARLSTSSATSSSTSHVPVAKPSLALAHITPSPLLMGIPHMPTYLSRETCFLWTRRRGSRTPKFIPNIVDASSRGQSRTSNPQFRRISPLESREACRTS